MSDTGTYLGVEIDGIYWHVEIPVSGNDEDGKTVWLSTPQILERMASTHDWLRNRYGEVLSKSTSKANDGAASSGGRSGQSRADRYPVLPDWSCDQCDGAVGRYPKTGQMRSDKAVCLGKCMDGGKYVHTVGWLDEGDASPQPVAAGPREDDGPAPTEDF